MLSYQEKLKIKDILSSGLNINPNINFPYYLDAIDQNKTDIESIKSEIRKIIYNQNILERKINMIIDLLNK